MARLARVFFLSLFVLAAGGTPCFAQRDGAPNNLCQDLANIPTMICFSNESQKADADLKALLSQILETLGPEDEKRLSEAQAHWEQYRKFICQADASVYFGGGSGESTEFGICYYVETRRQIKDLHDIYDWEMRPR